MQRIGRPFSPTRGTLEGYARQRRLNCSTVPISRVIRLSLDPPRDGYRVQGRLRVDHHMPLLNRIQQKIGLVPPAAENLFTTVKHRKLDSEQHNKVQWLRCFGDRGNETHFESTWTMDSPLAGVEQIGPLLFAQRIEMVGGSTTTEPGRTTRLIHEGTTLRGLGLPVPSWLVALETTMTPRPGRRAYDLAVRVTLLGRPMVSYTGLLEEACEEAG